MKDKKQKVLFVATVVKKHINVFHLPYLKWFKDNGYETHVAARNDFENEECIIPFCDVHYDIPFERNPIGYKNICAYKSLRKIIRENKYDIIHCHTPVAAILTRLAAIKSRKKGTKVIYTAHGFHFYKGAPWLNWLIYYPIELIGSIFTDVLITINNEDYKLAKKRMKAKKIEYIPGVGVNLEKAKSKNIDKKIEFGIEKDATVLLSVGELSKRKNHEIIIRSLAKLNKSNIYYIICGDGHLKEYLKDLTYKLNINNKVIFAGFRKDIFEICQSSDVFCFPSKQEGLPVALMEAMAVGLPVICSRIRGNEDLIEDGKGGYLCSLNNDEEFYFAIKDIVDNAQKMKIMGEYNINAIKKFDINNVSKEMQKIYAEV